MLTAIRQNYFKAFDKLAGQEHVILIDGNREAGLVAKDVFAQVEQLLHANSDSSKNKS